MTISINNVDFLKISEIVRNVGKEWSGNIPVDTLMWHLCYEFKLLREWQKGNIRYGVIRNAIDNSEYRIKSKSNMTNYESFMIAIMQTMIDLEILTQIPYTDRIKYNGHKHN